MKVPLQVTNLDLDAELISSMEDIFVSEGEEADLVQSIRGVGDQLTQEDLNRHASTSNQRFVLKIVLSRTRSKQAIRSGRAKRKKKIFFSQLCIKFPLHYINSVCACVCVCVCLCVCLPRNNGEIRINQSHCKTKFLLYYTLMSTFLTSLYSPIFNWCVIHFMSPQYKGKPEEQTSLFL